MSDQTHRELGKAITQNLLASADNWISDDLLPVRTVAAAFTVAGVNLALAKLGPEKTYKWLLGMIAQFEHDHFQDGKSIN